MSAATIGKINLWTIIVTCGLDKEFERDWLGKIKHRSSKRPVRADFTPEAMQSLAQIATALAEAEKRAGGAVTPAKDAVRKRLLAA